MSIIIRFGFVTYEQNKTLMEEKKMKKTITFVILLLISCSFISAIIIEDGIIESELPIVITTPLDFRVDVGRNIQLIGNGGVTIGGYNAPVQYVAKYTDFQGSYGNVIEYHVSVDKPLSDGLGMRVGKYVLNGVELGSMYVDYRYCGQYQSCSRMSYTINTVNGMERGIVFDGATQTINVHRNWALRMCQDASCYQYYDLTNQIGVDVFGKQGIVVKLSTGQRKILALTDVG